jgi:hypothetical protein
VLNTLLPLLLASAPLRAEVLSAPEPGRPELTLLVCPSPITCPEALMWVDNQGGLGGEGLLLLDAVLELDTGEWEDGEDKALRFRESLAAARAELQAGRPALAEGALSEAESTLSRWSGTATSAELTEVAWLRGALELVWEQDPGPAFRQAAVWAWNQPFEPPLSEPTALRRWGEAERALAVEPPGRLRLRAGLPGTVYALDGVTLGPGPVEVSLPAGLHRVTAWQEHTAIRWAASLAVEPGALTESAARFSRVADPQWVSDQIEAAIRGQPLPDPVSELLAEWCTRHGVRRLRLAVADPVRPDELEGRDPSLGMSPYRLRQVSFDPRQRSLSP